MKRFGEKARILLDEYLTAKRQYDYFIYTVKNESVLQRFHDSYGAHILFLINGTMLEDLIKKLYNVVYDSDDRSVSVVNLIGKTKIHKALLEEHAARLIPVNVSFGVGFSDEDKKELEARDAKRSAQERLERFKSVYNEFHDAFDEFSRFEPIEKWKEIRHKVVSHIDAKTVREELKRTHLSDFGMKYDDLDDFIKRVERLVDLADNCCASSDFTYDLAHEHNVLYAKNFWERARAGTRYRGGVRMTRWKRESRSSALRNYLR